MDAKLLIDKNFILHLVTYTVLVILSAATSVAFNYKLIIMILVVVEAFNFVIKFRKIAFFLTFTSFIAGTISIYLMYGFTSLHFNSVMSYQVATVISLLYLNEFLRRNEIQRKKLKNLSTIDYLSNIYNKRYFVDRIEEEIYRANRNSTKIGLLLFDIDKFKQVNDTYGHAFGDQLLREISDSISSITRKNEVFCRYGGDEFVLIITDYKISSYIHIKERIFEVIENLNKEHAYQDDFSLSLSIGLSVYPDDSNSSDDLFKKADLSMYESKSENVNSFTLYKSLKNRANSNN